MIKNILVPLDLSEMSKKQIEYSCALAKSLQSNIHFVHVLELNSIVANYERYFKELSELEFDLRKEIQDQLDVLLKHIDQSLNTQVHIVTGEASSEIVKYAKSNSIDLVVMCKHNEKSITKSIIGSKVKKVLGFNALPVLVLPGSDKVKDIFKGILL